ncbi:MAG: hypothetical protein AAF581_19870 [Planctomycetota bacterium]
MKKSTQGLIAFGFGVVFIIVMLVIVIAIPEPTDTQFFVFRVVLALAAAGAAAMIPGFLELRAGPVFKAGGAIAVFGVIYFYSPAALVSTPPPASSVALNHLELGTIRDEVTAALEFEIVDPAPGARAFVEVAREESFENPTVHQITDLDARSFSVAVRAAAGELIRARVVVKLDEREVYSNVREGAVP